MGPLFGKLTDYRAPFDLPAYHALNDLPWPAGWLSRLVGEHAFGAVCLAAAFGYLLFRFRRRAFQPLLTAGLALAATDLAGARLLKPLFHRLRPCFALPPGTFHQWSQVANQGSMPSLHAANAFAVAWVLARTVPRSAAAAYALAVLIALGRVVAGVHWPSDVVAGAAFGTAMGVLVTRLAKRLHSAAQRSQGGGQAPASASRQ